MKYKIGIFWIGGSWCLNGADSKVCTASWQGVPFADELVVVTGGCTGLPYLAAHEAAKGGVGVHGYSPVASMSEQEKFTPNDDLSIYNELSFTPHNLILPDVQRVRMKYRNVLSTAACDAGIIISGQWGSLNEFTNLVDMQKAVGVLTGTGGVADELPDFVKRS